jgi:peptidoglycan hydrolase-like protein with peptidoglycan-binding domain
MNNTILTTLTALSLSVIAATSALGQRANLPQYAQLKNPNAQSIEKLDMSAVPDLDRDEVRKVQTALQAKGFDPGSPDGRLGGETRAAVKKFQDRFGIKATGAIDNQTLFALGVVGGKTAAVEEEPRPRAEPKQPRTKTQHAPSKSAQSSRRGANSGTRGGARFCAEYSNGSRNCGFSSFQQCQASVSGVGGSCGPD